MRPPTIYIAGTGQHSGKTFFSLGFTTALAERGLKVGYMKPIGQRAVHIGAEYVDEDVVLMADVLRLQTALSLLNPVTLPSWFIRSFLAEERSPDDLIARIQNAYEEISAGKDLVIVEGTGNAGVGSVVGLSNARVASILGAHAMVITGGGVGRPIDEFSLNRALFDREQVPVAGVVANKFIPGRVAEFEPLLQKWFGREGVPLLGVIPYESMLTRISLRQIVDEVGAEYINGEDHRDMQIDDFVIGAAPPHRVISLLRPGVMAIIPGDRDDLVLAAVSAEELAPADQSGVAVCLTGGILPTENVMRIIHRTSVPVIASSADTFELATAMGDVVAKIAPDDTDKIELATHMVADVVDLQAAIACTGLQL